MFDILSYPVYENEGAGGGGSTSPLPSSAESSPASSAPSPSPTSSPSPSPSSEPSPGTGEVVAEGDDPFAGLGLEDLDAPALSAPSAPPVPTGQPPATLPVQPPATAQPPAAPPQPAPGQPPAPAQPSADAPQEEVDPASIEGIMQAFTEKGDDIIAKLASGPFALDKATQEALETDALAETPKLLAKTYLQAVSTSLKYMQQVVPNMINRQMAVLRAQQAGEQEFFKRWPQLGADRAKFAADIRRVASTFHQLNPKATREQIIANVGATVLAMHGIAPGAQPPASPQTPSQPPFVPAQSGAPVMSAPVASDEWDGLGQDFNI